MHQIVTIFPPLPTFKHAAFLSNGELDQNINSMFIPILDEFTPIYTYIHRAIIFHNLHTNLGKRMELVYIMLSNFCVFHAGHLLNLDHHIVVQI